MTLQDHEAARFRAFTILEVTFSLFLLILVMMTFTVMLTRFTQNQEIVDRREQAYLLAEGALNEIRAGAAEEAIRGRSVNNAIVEIRREAASGDWDGFDLVEVTVSVLREGRTTARARLAAYVERP